MKFKGTKGEWKASASSCYWDVDNGFPEDGNRVNITVFCYDNELNPQHFSEENKANAQAISAVPEMIEALESIVRDFEGDYMVDGEVVDNPHDSLLANYLLAKNALNKALSHEVECQEL